MVPARGGLDRLASTTAALVVLQADGEGGVAVDVEHRLGGVVALLLDLGVDVEVGQAAGLGDHRLQERAFLAAQAVEVLAPRLLRGGERRFARLAFCPWGCRTGELYMLFVTRWLLGASAYRTADRFLENFPSP